MNANSTVRKLNQKNIEEINFFAINFDFLREKCSTRESLSRLSLHIHKKTLYSKIFFSYHSSAIALEVVRPHYRPIHDKWFTEKFLALPKS